MSHTLKSGETRGLETLSQVAVPTVKSTHPYPVEANYPQEMSFHPTMGHATPRNATPLSSPASTYHSRTPSSSSTVDSPTRPYYADSMAPYARGTATMSPMATPLEHQRPMMHMTPDPQSSPYALYRQNPPMSYLSPSLPYYQQVPHGHPSPSSSPAPMHMQHPPPPMSHPDPYPHSYLPSNYYPPQNQPQYQQPQYQHQQQQMPFKTGPPMMGVSSPSPYPPSSPHPLGHPSPLSSHHGNAPYFPMHLLAQAAASSSQLLKRADNSNNNINNINNNSNNNNNDRVQIKVYVPPLPNTTTPTMVGSFIPKRKESHAFSAQSVQHKEQEKETQEQQQEQEEQENDNDETELSDEEMNESMTDDDSDGNAMTGAPADSTESAQTAFACPSCGRLFKRQEHVRRHQTVHSGERPYRCRYPGCLKTFSRSDNYAQHQKTHQRQLQPQQTMPVSLATVHQPSNSSLLLAPLPSPPVHSSLSSRPLLMSHRVPITGGHTTPPPLQQQTMNYGLYSPSQQTLSYPPLQSHVESAASVSTRASVSTTLQPPMGFSETLRRLEPSHSQTTSHHHNPLQTGMSSTIQQQNAAMTYRIQLPPRPPTEMLSEMYEHRFASPQVAPRASWTSPDVTPLVSPYPMRRGRPRVLHACSLPGCHKIFRRREHVVRHMRLHTGEKPYLCALCPARFSRRDTLSDHIKVVHHKRESDLMATAMIEEGKRGKSHRKKMKQETTEEEKKGMTEKVVMTTEKEEGKQHTPTVKAEEIVSDRTAVIEEASSA